MIDTRLRDIRLDPTDRHLHQTIGLIEEIQGSPRHMSQHVGGFTTTEGRRDELVPIEDARLEGRTLIPWSRGDIDSQKILKVDILALEMPCCLHKAFALVDKPHHQKLTLATTRTLERRIHRQKL